jgi:flagellar basal-body rod protein FlgC
MSMLNVFQVAGSALNAQSLRLNATASNLANADSVGMAGGGHYRARQVVFEAKPLAGGDAVGVQVRQVVEDASPPRLIYEPNSPLADAEGYVAMPNVNIVEEMVNMISASRAYQANVEVMASAKALLQKTLLLGQ